MRQLKESAASHLRAAATPGDALMKHEPGCAWPSSPVPVSLDIMTKGKTCADLKPLR